MLLALVTFLTALTSLSYLVCVFVLVPLLIFRRTRHIAAYGFLTSSFIVGAHLWFLSLMVTLDTWGWPAAVIGLLFLGVGIYPVAIVATVLASLWYPLGLLVSEGLITLVLRTVGYWFLTPTEEPLIAPAPIDDIEVLSSPTPSRAQQLADEHIREALASRGRTPAEIENLIKLSRGKS